MAKNLKKYLDPKEIKRTFSDEKKRKKFWTAAAILLGIIILFPKVQPLLSDLVYTSEEEPDLMQVDGVVVQAERLDNKISATGTLRAIQEVELRAEISGKVTGLHIEEGAEVERGQLLVKVNDNDLQAEKFRLESNIEVLEESQERQQQLFERGGATQEDYDNTLMQLNNVRAEYAAVQAQIERTEVRAPFEGTVGLTYISDGAYITPSTQIASLQDMSAMRIDFSIPERYSESISAGNEIRFEVQGSDSVFTGTVIAAEPQIDPRTRTLQVRAETDNSDGILNPGSFANIDLILETYQEAIMVPAVALIPDSGEYKVMVFKDGFAYKRPVKTGMRTRSHIQILEGLQPGEIVLTNGLLQVNDGSKVEIRTVEN
jgi:membrane fusion protein, multidrug efflux system